MSTGRTKRSEHEPIIAVTSGDPGGIGPEIVGRLFARFRPRRSVAVLLGSPSVLAPWLEASSPPPVIAPDELDTIRARRGRRFVIDTECRVRYRRGADSVGGGRHAGAALDVACRLAGGGKVQALVTAPISKKSLNLAGYRFPGHTELFAKHFRAPDCQMVMVYGDIRIMTLTRHVPIRQVGRAITRERIVSALVVLHRALRTDFGVPSPHIAVAALNPHAGDGGVIGREEIEVIKPALRGARRRGIRVAGPVAADALFQDVESGTFDAFVSMYHDQGLIPFKMRARRRGVNVTVGLPVVRTSVDHGVAYDIAGKGIASLESLEAAYRLAETLLERRNLPGRPANRRGEERATWNNDT